MDTSSTEDSIQVFIRVRPGSQQQGTLAYTQNQIKLDRHQFAFDKIFPHTCTQNQIFHNVGNRLLKNVLDGYNSCVFVYGQTGSGKTHTMIGENNGLMQQSFRELFSRINRLKNADCIVTCSYFQLYNEQIMDLLDPKKQKKLNIRQDAKKGVYIQNLTQQTALDSEKLIDVLYKGMKNRHIGQTQMNRQSSRSHSVFTISLSCKVQQDGKTVLKTPKLHFVDLAGSERQKMTQASGDRLKQAGNINKSLTSLGLVINALTSEKPRSHIPYRDSKLTCLLRDSLGGNSKTIIIATVSCALLSFQQTLSTLNFANRAKMVKVKALINEQSLSSNIQVYKEEIRKLKNQIMRLKSQMGRTPIKIIQHEIINSPKQIGPQFQHHFQQINRKINAISEQINQGVVSPSLQNMIQNLNRQVKMRPPHLSEMMDQQNLNNDQIIQTEDRYNADFIEYLNSNYQLLTQINEKVNQYLEIKQELKNVNLNKKFSIEHMRTPSKFQRDQYEQLLTKRQQQIRNLQQKLQILQNQLNVKVAEKNDAERKIQMYQEQNGNSESQTIQVKQNLLKAQQEIQIQKGKNQILKNQLNKIQKLIQQLEQRLKQTKQLYLYAQQNYENQQLTSKRLSEKLKSQEQQLINAKKLFENYKQQMKDLQNQIQNLKLTIQQKQSKQEDLRNQLNQMEETLQFNKKMINDITKKLASSNNDLLKQKDKVQQLQMKNKILEQEKALLTERIQNQTINYQIIIEQKSQQIRQVTIQNDKFHQQIIELNREHNQQKQKYEQQIQRMNNLLIQMKNNTNEKDLYINKLKNQLYMIQETMNFVKSEKQSQMVNLNMKLQAKLLECKMSEEKFESYTTQAQNLILNLKKNLESTSNKNITLQKDIQTLTSQYKKLEIQFKQMQSKFKSVETIYQQNQQLKKTYKQLVRQNYRLKGKYRQTENEELQKQKNEELLSKVQFYQEKFRLMSIEYQNATEIIKKLKQRQLQKNKKLYFYEQNMKLLNIDNELQQKQIMIKELKQQNRQLKNRLDNLESNISKQECDIKYKKIKQEKQVMNFTQKQQKIRVKMFALMKKWDGVVIDQDYTTEQMLDLCQQMINQQDKKYQAIAKGIKRQQKLKSQNHFILKENIYLKEKLQSLQKIKKVDQQNHPRPRKIIKTQ